MAKKLRFIIIGAGMAGMLAGIRLKERGYPKAGAARGDFYVEVRVAVPTELTDEERKHFEELARISKFEPRSSAKA